MTNHLSTQSTGSGATHLQISPELQGRLDEAQQNARIWAKTGLSAWHMSPDVILADEERKRARNAKSELLCEIHNRRFVYYMGKRMCVLCFKES